MSNDPCEGVFFVVRLPQGWQLCTCRHDEYGPMGLPDFWVEMLGSLLNLWLSHFEKQGPEEMKSRHNSLEKSLGQIVAGYDAFPRGEVRRGIGRKRFVVHHGGDMSRAMHIPRREVEEAFAIQGRTTWVADRRYAAVRESARKLRDLLPIEERWYDKE